MFGTFAFLEVVIIYIYIYIYILLEKNILKTFDSPKVCFTPTLQLENA